uniref:Uncharacterized mitochondrial protein AtMg00810-like n=1 Tax=Nicotiana tabacum TaxID=4097 RepID=A0A1S3ZEY5_TOBAC|nr:PREDICTED: uncharacterized mitochondrial protein AtMg00810-like [Nicotiana tabacum]
MKVPPGLSVSSPFSSTSSSPLFKIKDLGHVHYFLGLEVSATPEGFLICQQKFTSDLLAEFNCHHFTPVVTPLDPLVKLCTDMGAPFFDPSTYRRLVGKLNVLQHTWTDIAFSVQHLSQFLQHPQAACARSRKSVIGYYVTLGGSPISWKSKKQPTISISSAELEYRALKKVVAEVSWLVKLLGDMGFVLSSPIPIFCDSQTACHIAKNPLFHDRAKHIEIDCHYVRDCPAHHHLLCKLGVLHPPD